MPTVAFDFLGTLFSFEKAINSLHETLKGQVSTKQAAERLFYDWLWSGIRDYFAASHGGRYVPLMKVLESTLSRAMLIAGYSLPSSEQNDAIMKTFHELEPSASVLDALVLLKKNNWDIWVVTNGSYDATCSMLERANLLDYFRQGPQQEANVLSCDDLRISKPHPKVYSELMRIAVHRTQRIENFYLIASHAWDLAGAKNVSFQTVFLTTEEKVYPKEMYNGVGPDVQGDTILSCVNDMIQLENSRKTSV